MIWQWAAHGHNPAPGHTSVHSPQLRWCNIMTLLWQYVTWSGNCQDHQGEGDIGDVVAVRAVERVWGICDSDPSPSVWHLSQMRCSCYAVMTRDMRPDTIVQHCHPRVIRESPADKLGHCSTHDPTTKLARGEMNMRAERLFTLCRN